MGSSHALRRVEFRETPKGRPYLPDAPDLWFSFSACRLGFLGAWCSTHAIGVDIEERARPLEPVEMARGYFREAETRAIASARPEAGLQLFLKLWTLKEAALKSIGEGLPYGLDAFAFEVAPRPRVLEAPAEHGGVGLFDAWVIEGAETIAAVVCRSPADNGAAPLRHRPASR